jgi:hypothetical protein
MSDASQDDVIARYGGLFHGEDDLAASCLIQRDGRCVRLLQGLDAVSVRAEKAPQDLHQRLIELLENPIPPGWPRWSYHRYNSITSPEDSSGAEIAVFGQRPGELPGYYSAPADSEIGDLVRRIAAFQAADA